MQRGDETQQNSIVSLKLDGRADIKRPHSKKMVITGGDKCVDHWAVTPSVSHTSSLHAVLHKHNSFYLSVMPP